MFQNSVRTLIAAAVASATPARHNPRRAHGATASPKEMSDGSEPELGAGRGGEGGVGAGARNVRQRVANRPDWACEKMPLLMQNIRPKAGTVASDLRISPRWQLESLENLVSSGGRHGTVHVFKIIKVATNRSDDKMKVQQRARAGRNQSAGAIRWQRTVTLMCLLSPATNNVCVLFHGCGNNAQLFANELLVGPGDLRELQRHDVW